MKNKKPIKISYEPEADVLMWELNKKPIESAQEIGNLVVHFNKNHVPVLVELLEASRFFSKAKTIMAHGGRKQVIV